MTIATVRRLAADIMDVGENKIRISPDGLKEAEGALTRSDVRGLIDKGIVKKLKPQGRASTKRVGRTGHGRRRGTPISHKDVWMQKIRSQRNVYHMLVGSGVLKQGSKRAVYSKIKSGMLRSKRALLIYLKEANLVPKDLELPKREFKMKAPAPVKKKTAPAPAAKPVASARIEPRPAVQAQKSEPAGNKPAQKGERK